jgi:hypothetical protein
MPQVVYVFMSRRGKGRWRLLRFCEATRPAAERTAGGWRSHGAEVRIIEARIPDADSPQPRAGAA